MSIYSNNIALQTEHITFPLILIQVHVPQILVRMVLRVFQFLMDMSVNVSLDMEGVIVKKVWCTKLIVLNFIHIFVKYQKTLFTLTVSTKHTQYFICRHIVNTINYSLYVNWKEGHMSAEPGNWE